MLIRYGYEIKLTCQQPTALVCLLSVHEDRAADIGVPETTFTTPDVPVSTYRDLFGIWQNLALALGLKAVFLATTLFGVTTLWMAILADTGATVLVTANALRLLAYRPSG
jgi:hypothetical protein